MDAFAGNSPELFGFPLVVAVELMYFFDEVSKLLVQDISGCWFGKGHYFVF